jgi:hypothetical protein
MRRGILIALVVPAIALAGPRKKPKAKKPPPAETAKPEPDKPDKPDKSDKPDKNDKPDATPATPTPDPTGMPTTTKGTLLPGPLSTGTSPTGSGSAAPSTTGGNGTTAADEPADKDAKGADVDGLRQEYLSLRDELFKSRARANAVASQLYSTRVTIKLTWGSPRSYGVSKASIRLDGATVYEDSTGAIASDDGVRFDGYVAPGRHLVTFHVEATGKDDDSFTSATEAQIVVKAVANKDLVVAAKGKDTGDIAYAWKKSERGSYGLGIDVSVKSVASAGGKGKK